ncbi:MAG: HD domain-containing protein [Patescibacteria group bacterium]
MSRRYTEKENRLIEKAIKFLVKEYDKTGFNEKPVIFHSLRVACRLVEIDALPTIVAAAVLHDLTEDSKITLDQVRRGFGDKVARLVGAVSFKSDIADKEKQYKEVFERIEKAGEQALIIKCADILDNSDYYSFGKNKEHENLLMNKLNYFLKIAQPVIGKTILFKKLNKRYKILSSEYKKSL